MKNALSASFEAGFDRRRFLKFGSLFLISAVSPRLARGEMEDPGRPAAPAESAAEAPSEGALEVPASPFPERRISLYNARTGESLDRVYWADGGYVPDTLAEVDRLLRDHRNERVIPMDPALLDLLGDITAMLEVSVPIEVFSAYRSAETNAKLAIRSGRVARHSLHVQGKAVDIRIPGRDLKLIRDAAMELQAGGVGYYPRSGFIHIDTGPYRSWDSRWRSPRSRRRRAVKASRPKVS
jgi:uncharacterized protein YcbK (DUF882 family)